MTIPGCIHRIKRVAWECIYKIFEKSILSAIKEQHLGESFRRLKNIIGDEQIKYQYPYRGYEALNHPFWVTKVRAQHSFQISMVLKAIETLELSNKELTIVDIGDSAGSHILYLKELLKNVRSLSVNLDRRSIELIEQRGLEAVCSRAEELEKYNVYADIFMSFQMVEHLIDPIHFLKDLADKSKCEYFILTVPYLANSRVALSYIKKEGKKEQAAGDVHVFELDPEDWKLIFRFSGWDVAYERIYYQYPRKGIYRFLKNYWKKYDFEGFYGVVLRKNKRWSNLYCDW